MSKPLDRNWSGCYAEAHVFYQLSIKGYVPKMAKRNQKGYDLIVQSNGNKKIEVKHIQRIGNSANDSFVLKSSQCHPNSFDILILIISDCKNGNITSHQYYIFTWNEINQIVITKKKSSNYTFNLNNSGSHLASVLLSPYHNAWSKI